MCNQFFVHLQCGHTNVRQYLCEDAIRLDLPFFIPSTCTGYKLISMAAPGKCGQDGNYCVEAVQGQIIARLQQELAAVSVENDQVVLQLEAVQKHKASLTDLNNYSRLDAAASAKSAAIIDSWNLFRSLHREKQDILVKTEALKRAIAIAESFCDLDAESFGKAALFQQLVQPFTEQFAIHQSNKLDDTTKTPPQAQSMSGSGGPKTKHSQVKRSSRGRNRRARPVNSARQLQPPTKVPRSRLAPASSPIDTPMRPRRSYRATRAAVNYAESSGSESPSRSASPKRSDSSFSPLDSRKTFSPEWNRASQPQSGLSLEQFASLYHSNSVGNTPDHAEGYLPVLHQPISKPPVYALLQNNTPPGHPQNLDHAQSLDYDLAYQSIADNPYYVSAPAPYSSGTPWLSGAYDTEPSRPRLNTRIPSFHEYGYPAEPMFSQESQFPQTHWDRMIAGAAANDYTDPPQAFQYQSVGAGSAYDQCGVQDDLELAALIDPALMDESLF